MHLRRRKLQRPYYRRGILQQDKILMLRKHVRVVRNRNSDQLGKTAAFLVAKHLKTFCRRQKAVALLIPGGNSVKKLFQYLPKQKLPRRVWKKVHFFWADERLAGAGSPESNYRTARGMLSRIGVDKKNIHRFPGETTEPEKAARQYARELKKAKAGKIDILVLGVGEDGHVASLFPGHPSLNSRRSFVIVRNSPKLPAVRMSISPRIIPDAKVIVLLVIGQAKKAALAMLLNPKVSARQCPAKFALWPHGVVYLLTDL